MLDSQANIKRKSINQKLVDNKFTDLSGFHLFSKQLITTPNRNDIKGGVTLKFIGEFIREIDNKKTSFQKLLGKDDKTSITGSFIEDELKRHWHRSLIPIMRAQLLHEELSRYFDQIFVISHIEAQWMNSRIA